ncbi:MAG: TIGR02452 family protein [Eubacteriales bacterium]|nr:TIGR02452 family protein [Eubacteriales bacterium]
MRSDNVKMLRNTLGIFEKGYYIKDGRKVGLKLTREEQREAEVLLPDKIKDICENPKTDKVYILGRTGHFCVNEDSYSVAMSIKENCLDKEPRILVLNFANPVHPGGGVRNGARAQEEDLCRKSSLLLSLEDESAGDYYDYNSSLHTYMGSDAIILSPKVEIIKNAEGELLDESVVVSVMTCAAPMVTRGFEGMTKKQYEQMLYNRIMSMLMVAAHYDYNYLVLGAWGCGAFGNDARLMAELFYRALREFRYNGHPHENLFRQIYFAVLDRTEDLYNYRAFSEYFDFDNFYKEETEKEIKEALSELKELEKNLDKIKGSLFGGAIGDALGYPVEFMSEGAIFDKYGRDGITEYDLDRRTGKALISDDTQMTLFTANGMLVGETRLCMRGIGGIPHDYIGMSYEDWLLTQEMTIEQFEKKRHNGHHCISWLCDVPELYSRRAPGNTCISEIKEGCRGSVENHINTSKGCGGIMRVAPLALHYNSVDLNVLDKESAEVAALTHGHSLGYMPAAVLGHILSLIVYPDSHVTTSSGLSSARGMSLKDIVLHARDSINKLFKGDKHLAELDRIITKAVELSENDKTDLENIHELGEGWVAEETLAIAIYCSLRYQDDFSKGIIAAVNHKGDSDSTGAVTGNILGAWLGFEKIEEKWKKNLELYDVLEEMALDICHGCVMSEYGRYRDPVWITKYMDMRRSEVKPSDYDDSVSGIINSSRFTAMNDALRNGLF